MKLVEKFKSLKKSQKAYIIFAAACIVLSLIFLVSVACIVSEYEKAQPEKVVEREIKNIKKHMEKGTLDEYMDVCVPFNRFETSDREAYKKSRAELIKNASEITYTPDAVIADGLEKSYTVKADGKKLASIKLKGDRERTKLFFFSMADWKAESVTACDDTVDVKLYIPSGITAEINGKKVESTEISEFGNIPLYEVKGFVETPKLRFTNEDGEELGYYTNDGIVEPAVYNYLFTLGDDVVVSRNGNAVSGKKDENGNMVYEIKSMTDPAVRLRDMAGNVVEYHGESDLPVSTFTVEIPDNFVLSVNGTEISEEKAERSVNPDIANLATYEKVELRDILKYRLSSLKDELNVEITDNLGIVTEYTLNEFALSITGQSGEGIIPDEIASKIDVMKFGEDWSKFMTNDESFASISRYFVKDSYYYNYARKWATGIDHTFTSAHSAPKFEDKLVTDFVSYSDTCFSARVSLTKTMRLTRTGETKTDKLDMIVYFVNYDDTPDNGKDDKRWIVAAMHDVR